MDRPDAGPDVRAGARARRRRLRDAQRGRERLPAPRQRPRAPALRHRRPARPRPARGPGRRRGRRGDRAAQRHGAERSARRAVDGAGCARARRADVRDVPQRQRRLRGWAVPARRGDRGGVRRRAARPLAALRPLLHRCGGERGHARRLQPAAEHGGRRAGVAARRGRADAAAEDGRAPRRPRGAERARAPDRAGRPRGDAARRRGDRRRAPGDRGDDAGADRAHRLRAAAPRAARPAHAALSDGQRHQDPGRVRPPVLARRGADRAGGRRRRPRADHLRQLAAVGRARDPARVHRGRAGPRVDAAQRGRPARRGHRQLRRVLRPEGARGPRLRRARLVRRGVVARVLRRRGAAGRPARLRARAARAGRAHPLGGDGDGDDLERLHGRRRALRRARGGRGAGRAAGGPRRRRRRPRGARKAQRRCRPPRRRRRSRARRTTPRLAG